MGDDRQERLARHLTRLNAAGYDDPCFQIFLFYPRPDHSWQIVLSEISELHANFWRRVVRPQMARDWGIDVNQIPGHLDHSLIPSGYVDFEEVRGRDRPFMVIPEQLPPGWTEDSIRSRLHCGHKIFRTTYNGESLDPDLVKSYLTMFQRSQTKTASGE